MRYEELVATVKKATHKMRVSKDMGHIAYQFNVEGEAQGAFYLEIAEGKVFVEPYEYYDRDIIIETSAKVILQMISGDLQPMAAYTNGLMRIHGDVEYLKMLPFGCECKKPGKK